MKGFRPLYNYKTTTWRNATRPPTLRPYSHTSAHTAWPVAFRLAGGFATRSSRRALYSAPRGKRRRSRTVSTSISPQSNSTKTALPLRCCFLKAAKLSGVTPSATTSPALFTIVSLHILRLLFFARLRAWCFGNCCSWEAFQPWLSVRDLSPPRRAGLLHNSCLLEQRAAS